MSKKSSNLLTTQASPEEIYFVIKRKVFVYPIYKNGKFYIQVDNNGKLKTFEKSVAIKDLNDAIAKTIKHYYKLLKKL